MKAIRDINVIFQIVDKSFPPYIFLISIKIPLIPIISKMLKELIIKKNRKMNWKKFMMKNKKNINNLTFKSKKMIHQPI